MTAACDLLEAEIALDRVDAELAVELPTHMRAFAAAHAAGTPPPPAPAILRRASTASAIQMGRAHPLLEDRALALARLAWPIAIEDDPRVVAARAATPTWDALATLTAARDEAARERFGRGFLPLVHELHGVTRAAAGDAEVAWPTRIAGWHADGADIEVGIDVHRDVDREAPDDPVDAAWRVLAARHGARGTLQLVHARAGVHARTFVVEPQRHAIVVVPPLAATLARTSGATRFAIIHELGHALVALLAPAGVPRVVDEAVAAYVARGLEVAGALPPGWPHPLAGAARDRRTQLARALDAIERGARTRPTERPPWALWHDPGAQAAYVEAEAIAERWWQALGPSPAPDALAGAIAQERARVDGASRPPATLPSGL